MPRYRDDYDDIRLNVRDQGPKPMSGMGLASLLIAIGMGLLLLVLVGIAGIVSAEQGGQMNENDPAAILLGLGILGGLGGTLIGLVLGIVGCYQPDRSIVLAVLGTIFNGLVILGVLSLFCIGILMG
jgi:hypothetical protein